MAKLTIGGGAGCYEEAGWANHGQEANQQSSSMASAAAPAPGFQVAALSSRPNFPGQWPTSH